MLPSWFQPIVGFCLCSCCPILFFQVRAFFLGFKLPFHLLPFQLSVSGIIIFILFWVIIRFFFGGIIFGWSRWNCARTLLEEAMSSLQTELLMTISLFLNSFFYQTNEHLSVCLSASTCLSVLHRQKQLVLDKRRKSQVKVQVQGKPSLSSPFFSFSSQEKACIRACLVIYM